MSNKREKEIESAEAVKKNEESNTQVSELNFFKLFWNYYIIKKRRRMNWNSVREVPLEMVYIIYNVSVYGVPTQCVGTPYYGSPVYTMESSTMHIIERPISNRTL